MLGKAGEPLGLLTAMLRALPGASLRLASLSVYPTPDLFDSSLSGLNLCAMHRVRLNSSAAASAVLPR